MNEAFAGYPVDGSMLRIRNSPLFRIADPRVAVAWNLAREAHRKQFRKVSGLPFFVHPIAVAENLAALNCPVELVIAALLHDTVEDAIVSLAAIEKLFGDKVVSLVDGMTSPRLPGETWRQRRYRLLANLESASDECLLLKCADALDNIRSIRVDMISHGDSVWQMLRPREDLSWYYRSLRAVFSRRLVDGIGKLLVEAFDVEFRALFA